MKRITLCLLWMMGVVLPSVAQQPVSAAEQAAMIQAIVETTSHINTMQCSFRQVKTLSLLNEELVSTGTMLYGRPALLHWQYLKPYTYTFIINGSRALMKNPNQKHVIDTRQSKLLGEITQIMVNSVTGKCLTEKGDFNIRMCKVSGEWIAKLQPVHKELKAMFKLIKLHIDPKAHSIGQVELQETTGDVTRIYLSDYQLNAVIDEKMFAID